jgi:TonB-dependent SusC/RagA subfamily outer membrane receptor
MHRTPLILALLLQAPAAAAQLRSAADSLPPLSSPPSSHSVVEADSVPAGAVRTLPDLLATRVPGLLVERSSGALGAGSRIRLRGSAAMVGATEPLVVVDGVRYVSDANSLLIDVGGSRPSRFDDLDPEDVESVRVLPGPAGAALYGSAGANGVVEVRTRRGASGPRVRAFVAAGARTDAASYPANYAQVGVLANGARTTECTLLAQASRACTPKADSLVSASPFGAASPFRTGMLRTVGVSVGGAVPLASYYVSADADRETGVLDPERQERTDLRANLALRPFVGAEVTASAGRREGSLELAPTSANRYNPITPGMEASPLGPSDDDAPSVEGRLSSVQDVVHTTFGVRGEWRPLSWLSAGASLGEDRIDRDEDQARYAGSGAPEWEQTAGEDRRLRTVGADATVSLGLGRGVGSTTTLGWERVTDRMDTFLRAQSSSEEITFRGELEGRYLRQQVAWRDRVLMEGTLRGDKSDLLPGGEPRWSSSLGARWALVRGASGDARVGEVTLRAGYGSIAREIPVEVFAAIPVCPVFGPCDEEALRPEVFREREAGIDATLLGGRLGVALTGYDRETRDALATVWVSGSDGLRIVPRNVGSVHNRGIEAAVRADLVVGPRLRWSVDLVASGNRNRLEAGDGDDAAGVVTTGQYHWSGHPLGGYFFLPILGATDRNGDGKIGLAGCPGPACELEVGNRLEYLGSPTPSRVAALGSRLGLGERVSVHARLEHQGGARLLNYTRLVRCLGVSNCRELYDPSTPLDVQAGVAAYGWAGSGTQAGFIEDADFVKLREVAVTLSAPAGLARRVGASGLDLTLAGRNLATWTGYSGLDPEVNAYGQAPFHRADLYTLPLTRQWTTRLDVRF